MKALASHRFRLAIALGFALIFLAGALIAYRSAQGLSAGLGAALDLDSSASSDVTPKRFIVARGESAAAIASRLEAAGLIRSALAFRLLAKSGGVEFVLAAGEYDIRPNMRPTEILVLMRQNAGPGLTVTFPEGWQSLEMADRLEASGVISRTEFLRSAVIGVYDYPFLTGRQGVSLEGYLFPDTYNFKPNMPGHDVVDSMLRDFDRRFDIAVRQQAEKQGLSIAQVVIIASIVEREAVVAEERAMIAEVFLNRLALRMPLQADPTVQYALAREAGSAARPPYWKQDLSTADLQIDSPYNTYRYPSLPPTAISNPGLASLKATVTPTSTGYLYFVAKSDGTHAFARTLDEHNDNVARYRSLSRAR